MIKEYEGGVYIELKKKEKGGGGGFRNRGLGLGSSGSTNNIKSNKFFKDLPIEACDYSSTSGNRYYSHGLVQVIHDAFNAHRAIELAPDHFWLMICQAISNHEEKTGILGKLHDLPSPKREIEIEANDFRKGSADNDWPRVFGEFEKGIKENIPETLYNLVSNKRYSTTTKIDQICFTVCLMDTLKKYFNYSVMTLCKIPKIYLKGNLDDWKQLYANTKQLSEAGLEMWNWFDIILNILEKFIDVFEGKGPVDKKFWSSIYKYMNGSGGPSINGWICAFFPYLNRNGKLEKAYWLERVKDNDWMSELSGGRWHGIMCPSNVPNGVNAVPFTWKYLGTPYPYNFYAGFLGLEETKDDRKVLTPRLGWAVGAIINIELAQVTEDGR